MRNGVDVLITIYVYKSNIHVSQKEGQYQSVYKNKTKEQTNKQTKRKPNQTHAYIIWYCGNCWFS